MSPRLPLLVLLFASMAAEGQAAETSAREAGRAAFRQGPGFPWYDAENDALKPIELRDVQPPRQGNSAQPVAFPVTPLAVAAWGVLLVLLALLVALIVWAWRSMPESAWKPDSRSVGRSLDSTGDLDALPVRDLRDAAGLRAAAEAASRAGRYREAMIYLFSYQLVTLDRSHLIHLARGKTNRQYLRELGGQQRLGRLMSDSVSLFEDAFFGGRALQRGEFERCWAQLDEFQALTAAPP